MGKQKFVYDYPRPMVTVDVIIVTREKTRHVLLVRRKNAPFAGKWAIPGGFVEMDEPLDVAARRELREETGVKTATLTQLETFGDPERDPRGRVISVAYVAIVNRADLKPVAADDAAAVGWFPLSRPPQMAFDHLAILRLARRRLATQVKRARKRS